MLTFTYCIAHPQFYTPKRWRRKNVKQKKNLNTLKVCCNDDGHYRRHGCCWHDEKRQQGKRTHNLKTKSKSSQRTDRAAHITGFEALTSYMFRDGHYFKHEHDWSSNRRVSSHGSIISSVEAGIFEGNGAHFVYITFATSWFTNEKCPIPVYICSIPIYSDILHKLSNNNFNSIRIVFYSHSSKCCIWWTNRNAAVQYSIGHLNNLKIGKINKNKRTWNNREYNTRK